MLLLCHSFNAIGDFAPFLTGCCTIGSVRSEKLKKEVRPVATLGLWQELYEAAMLELRPEDLQERIVTAEAAIRQRIQELQADSGGGSPKERQAIADALHNLRILAGLERKSQGSSSKPGSVPDQAGAR